MGNPFKKIFNKLGDALIPKELAPFLGPATAMFAPQLGLPAALIGGQLASAKMHGGSLDPFQALAATGSYYGGGGQEIRARGGNLTQRLTGGIKSAGAGQGFSFKPYKGSMFESYNPTSTSGVSGSDPFSRALGSTYKDAEYTNYLKDKAEFNSLTKDLDKQLAEGTITQENYDIQKKLKYDSAKRSGTFVSDVAYEDFKDPRSLATKAGDIFKKGSEGFMPGFMDEDQNGIRTFNFKKFLQTTASVTSLSQMKVIAEELKRAELKSKEEEGQAYRTYFEQYESVLPLDAEGNKQTYLSHSGEFADPILVKKYREYMAKGGIIGYSNGGMTRTRYKEGGLGSIPQTPTVPEGMQLDGRGGGFIPMGAQEKKDDVPAMLAKNEFVLTADAMRGFDKATGGDGNPRDAAAKMYEIMSNYEAMA